MNRTALVVGITGIGGNHVARELLGHGWHVIGLSRRAPKDLPDVPHVAADLLDPAALHAALGSVAPTHVFITTWMRQDTERKTSASTRRWCATCSTPCRRKGACATLRWSRA
jgi:nucleoside-diphosphate-sugar epimerase